MKKIVIILIIIVILLSIGLGITLTYRGKIQIPLQSYIVKGKVFGEDEEIRSFITPNAPCIKNAISNYSLSATDELSRITKAYNFLETNYHYVMDNNVTFSNGTIVLQEINDFWQMPIISMAIINRFGGFNGDCEDGSFLLQSILETEGIVSNVYIGTITLPSGIWGHAWMTVTYQGREYLLETTIGEPLQILQSVPSFYHADIKFNSSEVYLVSGKDINQVIIYPPLPTNAISELRKALFEGGV